MHRRVSALERRYDIDWLRVMAVLVLIPYHTARIFDVWEPFYAKSAETSRALTCLFVGAVNPWHMQLFFLLAGASTWFALGFRSGGQYVKQRLRRLIIPLIFGVLVIVPPQSYLGAQTYDTASGPFWAYYPHFFQIGPTGDLTGYMGGFTPAHLWFVLFLFIISLAALPLLLHLRSETGGRFRDRLASFFIKPGALFLLAVPILLAMELPDIGGKNIFYYLVFFLFGYVLVADARLEEAVDRHKVPALILGLGLLVSTMTLWAFDVSIPGWLNEVLGTSLWSVGTWLLLIAILGFGRKYLNFGHPVLKYASEAAYPFYILHQTVIVVIGFLVVQWNIGVWPQFAVIVVASTLATVLIYEVLVKRMNVMRFLFGMKTLARRKPARQSIKQTG